tara:strand:- start:2074 stop:2346 length:273 start_codon:yes stop_codon:yes gene_type:complete
MKLKIKVFVIVYLISTISVLFSKSPITVEDNEDNNLYIQYEIQYGDSLWSIADQFNSKNKEKFIYNIKKINNLENSLLIVNNILLIPSNI